MPQLVKTEQVDRVEVFARESGQEDYNEQFTNALKNTYFNLKWADEYVPIIKNAVQAMHLSEWPRVQSNWKGVDRDINTKIMGLLGFQQNVIKWKSTRNKK